MKRTAPLAAASALALCAALVPLGPWAVAADITVTFHHRDAANTITVETTSDGTMAIPETAPWDGHTFAGWYTSPTPGRADAPATAGGGFFGPTTFTGLTSDVTLYGQWIEDSQANPNVHTIATASGTASTVLGYSTYSGIDLITANGAAVNPVGYTPDGTNPIFKDLNKNSRLDVYEDWTRSTEDRAADLAAQLAADPDGVQQIAGLMLYSGHQTDWSDAIPNQDQITFLVNDDLRHVLIAGSAAAGQMGVHAEWNNNIQSIVEALGYGIPANNSSDPRHGTSSTSDVEFFSANTGVSAWPSSLGMGATFDPAVNKLFGKIASAEYRALGIATALSPQIDIATDPRWGRYNGTFGEDPKLASAMSRAYVDGFQTTYANTDRSTPDVYDPIANDAATGGWGYQSVNAMMKHWPGGGAGEGGRDAHYNYGKYAVFPGGNWTAHLIPFVDGSLSLEDGTEMATAVMPYYTVSYLQVPGSLSNESNSPAASLNMANAYSDYMINGVLRDSYDFDGVVCTDWNVVGPATGPGVMFDGDLAGMIWGVDDHYPANADIDTDGSFTDMAARARMLLDAGVDQFGGLNTTAPIVKAYNAATPGDKAKLLDQMEGSAYRLLKNIFRTGLFENPYLDADHTETTVGQQAYMEAGYDAQLKSMVLAKNQSDLLPLDKSATTVYAPANADVPLASATIDLLETYFGTGNVITDPADAASADVALVFMNSISSGGGSRDMTAHTNSYAPINLDFKDYTATDARTTSVAGEPIRDSSGAVIGQANRSYKGVTTEAYTGIGGGFFGGGAPDVAGSAAGQLERLAAAKASGKPVIVVFDTSNPAVLTEIEPSADAILVTFQSQRSAVLDMLTGSTEYKGAGSAEPVHPTGMLPLQFPKDMAEVEAQAEDVPRDMVPYTDAAGNAYDFGFGLTWAHGTTTRIDATVNPGYTQFVTENAVPMSVPVNTGTNAASAYSIANRAQVTFDYGYTEAATDRATKRLILTVTKGTPVVEQAATRAGHTFTGWYTSAGEKVDFTRPIYADTTVTARWDAVANPAGEATRSLLASLVGAAAHRSASDYTPASWAVYQAALAKARDVQAKAALYQATEADVAAAIVALVDAVSGLTAPVPATNAPAVPSQIPLLKSYVDAVAGKVASAYTPESWAAFASALAGARAILANPAASDEQVARALVTLLQADAALAAPPSTGVAPPVTTIKAGT
ncbi:MAG: glycoside hydrolase family 3 C-terminal domain-containing protein, partial [Bifidobacteriaceae bacterium]|nr:glycoside hydrolase family 3 C-terminal domain-containing protein [Bifidobacteriaceae bacterium]